ncbi:MAG: alpha/beta fold hydrolase [Desulfomonile tiedjei]|uniref:Alpha/beta fold hydrolase n=1 Tax=Desulfomonile tiedjei TaxID=2358 RepID=A0A9D6V994_9BACT|nr:alpha/beta fold hydrolase [Desulfomonile tiedjei]
MLAFLLTIFFSVVLVIGFVVLSGYFWHWYYYAPTCQDETYYFTTKDGWRLAAHHYRPSGEPSGLPVILCHGLSSNRYAFDLPGAPSLARFLKSKGRDVWSVELRGSGMSDRSRLLFSDVPYNWEFEEHLLEDAPAVIDFVLSRTGASKAHWVGHSMGGMLILAHLSRNPHAAISSAVTVGSPVNFLNMRTRQIGFLLKITPLFDWLPISPLPFFGRLMIPVVHRMPKPLLGIFNLPNIAPDIARKTVVLCAELITSNRIWLTFGRYIDTGAFAPENSRPYLDGLAEANASILFIGGSKDAMAPDCVDPDICTPENAAGPRKTLIAGTESGFMCDYGHMDLLVGNASETEIFPTILAWLLENDPQ